MGLYHSKQALTAHPHVHSKSPGNSASSKIQNATVYSDPYSTGSSSFDMENDLLNIDNAKHITDPKERRDKIGNLLSDKMVEDPRYASSIQPYKDYEEAKSVLTDTETRIDFAKTISDSPEQEKKLAEVRKELLDALNIAEDTLLKLAAQHRVLASAVEGRIRLINDQILKAKNEQDKKDLESEIFFLKLTLEEQENIIAKYLDGENSEFGIIQTKKNDIQKELGMNVIPVTVHLGSLPSHSGSSTTTTTTVTSSMIPISTSNIPTPPPPPAPTTYAPIPPLTASAPPSLIQVQPALPTQTPISVGSGSGPPPPPPPPPPGGSGPPPPPPPPSAGGLGPPPPPQPQGAAVLKPTKTTTTTKKPDPVPPPSSTSDPSALFKSIITGVTLKKRPKEDSQPPKKASGPPIQQALFQSDMLEKTRAEQQKQNETNPANSQPADDDDEAWKSYFFVF